MPGHITPAAPASSTMTLRRLASVFAASMLIAAVAAPATATAASHSVAHQSRAKITKVAQTHLAKQAGKPVDAGAAAGLETGPREADAELDAKAGGSQSAKRVPADHVPTPAGLPVTGAAGATGFDGQTHLDQRTAGTGTYANTNFSTEPPDMGLCVGNGFVVQGVNTSLRV
ncbi:MAG: hypothetical protein QOI00_614, partial [Chloroflexota bacterium]|nr:hypothetical protein [Chloroflexota bacterium]